MKFFCFFLFLSVHFVSFMDTNWKKFNWEINHHVAALQYSTKKRVELLSGVRADLSNSEEKIVLFSYGLIVLKLIKIKEISKRKKKIV